MCEAFIVCEKSERVCVKNTGETINKCVEPCNTLFGPYVIWRCSVATHYTSLGVSLSLALSLARSLSLSVCVGAF